MPKWFCMFLLSPFTHHPLRHPLVLDIDRHHHEKPLHFLSFDDLVFYYGERSSWLGDTDAYQTRTIYHKLLPSYHTLYTEEYDPETLAYKAFRARQSAKEYARYIAFFYLRWISQSLDGVRNLLSYQKLEPSFHDIGNKYNCQYDLIAQKSCSTNKWFDIFSIDLNFSHDKIKK